MKLAETEIGSDLGSLPPATKRRVLVEFLIENQLFADAAEAEKLASGAAFNERMQYWRRRALRDAYFDKTVKDTVSDADAKKFYDSQVGGAKPEEEVRARHILVESKEKAREIYEKIAHGSDFAKLAKENSKDPGSKDQGGELGYFRRGQMVPQFEEVAFKLQKGEVGEPFQTQFGWHVIRVDDRRQSAAPPFEAVKDRVVAAMIHQKAQQIAGDLRGKAQIEYIDPEIKSSVDGERSGRAQAIGRAADADAGDRERQGGWHGQGVGKGFPVRACAPARRCPSCRASGSRPARPASAMPDRTDLMLAVLDPGTTAAGVLTRSKTCSAPVLWCREGLTQGKARALVVNSGNANAFTGKKGGEATRLTAEAAAKAVGCSTGEVFMSSTGVIGEPLDAGKFTHLLDGLAQVRQGRCLGDGGARHHDHRHVPQARHPHGAARRARTSSSTASPRAPA